MRYVLQTALVDQTQSAGMKHRNSNALIIKLIILIHILTNKKSGLRATNKRGKQFRSARVQQLYSMDEQASCYSCPMPMLNEEQNLFNEYDSGSLMSQLFGVETDVGSTWMENEVMAEEMGQCFEEGDCFVADEADQSMTEQYTSSGLIPSQAAFENDCSSLKKRYQPFRFLRRNPFFARVGRRNFNMYGEHDLAVDERPRKRHICLSLACVVLAFLVISWRRGNFPLSPKLFPTRNIPPPNTCGRHRTWFSRGVALAGLTTRMLLGADWAGFGTHYCGPLNGGDFSLAPVDVLDAMCAQHDYCIERSRYLVSVADQAERLLYPIGVVDDDDFQRCGIPLQSHKNPNFGIRIKACDEEFLVWRPFCPFLKGAAGVADFLLIIWRSSRRASMPVLPAQSTKIFQRAPGASAWPSLGASLAPSTLPPRSASRRNLKCGIASLYIPSVRESERFLNA